MSLIVFTGGGSGGHIFPGLSVVDFLKTKIDCKIVWIGAKKGIDREILESHGISFYGISSGKFRRYFSLSNIIDLFRIVIGFFSSFILLIKLRPVLVFSKGGFVSVPPCFAAKLLSIPVITHESDFSPGLATKLNARVATDIYLTYEETGKFFSEYIQKKITITGNPVRSVFYSGSATKGRSYIGCTEKDLPVLFIQGGSLGARQINSLISECIENICAHFFVVHQTGSQNIDQSIQSDNPLVLKRYVSFPFIGSEMPDVLSCASIVLARSGANTVWECAAAGKPMILIPLEKGSSRGDQIENAHFFVSRGAAIMLTGSDVSSKKLLEVLTELHGNLRLYADMSSNSEVLGKVRSASVIAELIAIKLSGGKS